MRRVLTACLVFLFILCIDTGTSFCGQIYKWVDENGVVHFTDSLNDESVIKNHDVEVRWTPEREEPSVQTGEQAEEMAAEKGNPKGEYYKKVKKAEEYNASLKKELEERMKDVEAYKAKAKESNITQNSSVTNSIPSQGVRVYNSQVRKHNAKLKSKKRIAGRSHEKRLQEYNKKKKEVEDYNAKVRKNNAKLESKKRIAERSHEKRLQEYNKKKKEVEDYNSKVRKHNAKVRKHNAKLESKRRIAERRKAHDRYKKSRLPGY